MIPKVATDFSEQDRAQTESYSMIAIQPHQIVV